MITQHSHVNKGRNSPSFFNFYSLYRLLSISTKFGIKFGGGTLFFLSLVFPRFNVCRYPNQKMAMHKSLRSYYHKNFRKSYELGIRSQEIYVQKCIHSDLIDPEFTLVSESAVWAIYESPLKHRGNGLFRELAVSVYSSVFQFVFYLCQGLVSCGT